MALPVAALATLLARSAPLPDPMASRADPPTPAAPALNATARAQCSFVGTYHGSEDASLWRDGIALVSSGLFISEQPGLMLALDLNAEAVEPVEMELRNMPAGFGFRPHGMHIHNATQRVFVISHSDLVEEESIVAFDIVAVSGSRIPALAFRFALITPEWPWWPEENIWWLNDLGVVGENELFVTQFGPQGRPLITKHLWHASWDEEELRPDGRLPCRAEVVADGAASLGLNGMNVVQGHPDMPPMLWANDLFLDRLWVFERTGGAGLRRLANMELPGTVDNVELDSGSRDLTMGLCCGSGNGAILAERAQDPQIILDLDQLGLGRPYAVSTSLRFGRWLLLGSPADEGPVVCDMGAPAPTTPALAHGDALPTR